MFSWHFCIHAPLNVLCKYVQVQDIVEHDIWEAVYAEGTDERHIKLLPSIPHFKVCFSLPFTAACDSSTGVAASDASSCCPSHPIRERGEFGGHCRLP